MKFLRLVLKQIMRVLYAVFVGIVLYFPAAELLTYIGRETRLFTFPPMMPVEDVLLPALFLAVLYGAASLIRRRIEPVHAPADGGGDPSGT